MVVTGSYEMELTTPRGLLSSDITAGETKRIDLVVKNTGSAELKDIELSASKPVDWEVTFEPAKLMKLGAGPSSCCNISRRGDVDSYILGCIRFYLCRCCLLVIRLEYHIPAPLYIGCQSIELLLRCTVLNRCVECKC